MDALYADAHFDDLDPDARSQRVDKGKKSELHALAQIKIIKIINV